MIYPWGMGQWTGAQKMENCLGKQNVLGRYGILQTKMHLPDALRVMGSQLRGRLHIISNVAKRLTASWVIAAAMGRSKTIAMKTPTSQLMLQARKGANGSRAVGRGLII